MKTRWDVLKVITLLTSCIITISCSSDNEINNENNTEQKYKIVKITGATHSNTIW